MDKIIRLHEIWQSRVKKKTYIFVLNKVNMANISIQETYGIHWRHIVVLLSVDKIILKQFHKKVYISCPQTDISLSNSDRCFLPKLLFNVECKIGDFEDIIIFLTGYTFYSFFVFFVLAVGSLQMFRFLFFFSMWYCSLWFGIISQQDMMRIFSLRTND